jgi:hypothetical protein
MNIIIRIWLLITCLALGFFYANSLLVRQKLKEKYPNAVFKRRSFLGSFTTFVQSVFMCACPFIHLVLIYVSIFEYDIIIDKVVQHVEQSMKEEQK